MIEEELPSERCEGEERTYIFVLKNPGLAGWSVKTLAVKDLLDRRMCASKILSRPSSQEIDTMNHDSQRAVEVTLDTSHNSGASKAPAVGNLGKEITIGT